MSIQFRPPATRQATRADLYRARQRADLLRSELPRVRAAALAWRNGLAALLAGLVGFGLLKGRSNVSELAHPTALVVGLLLTAALVVGATGALWLMSAAHGLPAITPTAGLNSLVSTNHADALRVAIWLRRGIAATLGCAALLVGAVGTTWYGPAAARPLVQVTTPTGVWCGSLVRIDAAGTVLTTPDGQVTLPRGPSTVVRVDGTACTQKPQ